MNRQAALKSYDQMLSLIEAIGIKNPVELLESVKPHIERWKADRAVLAQIDGGRALVEGEPDYFDLCNGYPHNVAVDAAMSRLADGKFYDDYDQGCADLGTLRSFVRQAQDHFRTAEAALTPQIDGTDINGELLAVLRREIPNYIQKAFKNHYIISNMQEATIGLTLSGFIDHISNSENAAKDKTHG